MRYQAPTSPDVLAALQLALTLKRMEVSLYSQAIAASGFVPAADAGAMNTISAHEAEHAASLHAAILARGGTPDPEPTFDFTAAGALPGFAFGAGQYSTFLGLAQAIEDLGVRALKGQLTALMPDKGALTLVMSMHAVEAEHGARIRALRGQKSWITQASRDTLPDFLQPVYAGEEAAVQGTVNVATLPLTALNGGADAATQAFDEPLGTAQANAVIDAFIA